jgi:uncharacterized membrane protein
MKWQMPFCSQCGNQVDAAAPFCGRCGARQPVGTAGSPVAGADPLSGISPRTASILCYIPWIGWVIAIVVLATDRFRPNRVIRFHAFQALYLFVASLLNNFVVSWIPWPLPHVRIHELVSLVLAAMSIFMMVKAAHEQAYSLPLFGELAARSVEGH